MNPETIVAAIAAATALIEFITKSRADAQQNAEWTDLQRATMDAQIASIPQLPHWQPND